MGVHAKAHHELRGLIAVLAKYYTLASSDSTHLMLFVELPHRQAHHQSGTMAFDLSFYSPRSFLYTQYL
jgi:hypothetical protein